MKCNYCIVHILVQGDFVISCTFHEKYPTLFTKYVVNTYKTSSTSEKVNKVKSKMENNKITQQTSKHHNYIIKTIKLIYSSILREALFSIGEF
jgi:hypothetical protein